MRLEDEETSTEHLPGTISNGGPHSSSPSASRKSLANGSSAHSVEPNGHSGGAVKAVAVKPTGPYYGHSREEVARILIQSLTDLGYHGAANVLSRESGYELENTSVASFRTAIQEGDWSEAEALLFGRNSNGEHGGVGLNGNSYTDEQLDWLAHHGSSLPGPGLPLAEGANQREMLFLIRQQRYLELLEKRDIAAALVVLRKELQPLHQDRDRLHALSNLMMCNSAEKLRRDANWDGAAGESRNYLLSELSTSIAPEVMIPEHRLAVLLDKVQERQLNLCLYHNTVKPHSLYHDHFCDPADFPKDLLCELRDHTDEVWFIAFSNAGDLLATTSLDSAIYIYSTSDWKAKMRLSWHGDGDGGAPDVPGIASVAWSPDDQYLLACSRNKDLVVYDVGGVGEKILTIDHFDQPVTSAAWTPDGQSFVVASHDHQHGLEMFRLGETEPFHSFSKSSSQPMRFSDCAISADGTRLAAVTVKQQCVVYVYDLTQTEMPLVSEFQMQDMINCIRFSQDGQTLLLGLNHSNLLLLETTTGAVIADYPGFKAENFVIRSSLGGAGGEYVISGSEDSHVYIWKKSTGLKVLSIEAHPGVPVNAVAWHPTNPAIFATCGDDRRVKIWASPNEVARWRAARGGASSQLRGAGTGAMGVDQSPPASGRR